MPFAISEDATKYFGSFHTIDEAISKGEEEGYSSFWVGECVPPTQPEAYWDIDDWLELVSTQDEYCGDHADSWDNSTRKQRDELDNAVQMLMSGWLDKYDLRPKFFSIKDESRYILDSTTGKAVKV